MKLNQWQISTGSLAVVISVALAGCSTPSNPEPKTGTGDAKPVPISTQRKDRLTKTSDEWRTLLGDKRFRVMREKGTEAAFSGDLWEEHRPGIYACAGCGLELFSSATKFDSGTGWPSFYDTQGQDAVATATDSSHGMDRTEVLCARCDGHLGHLFEDGPPPTGKRYCINSASLKFVEKGATRAAP